MPGSQTTPGRMGTRVIAPIHVAFHTHNGVGTRNKSTFAAQWLAYALPYRRFADAPVDTLTDILVNACARLGADAVRYSFIVADFHRLLLAGLTGALWVRFGDRGVAEGSSESGQGLPIRLTDHSVSWTPSNRKFPPDQSLTVECQIRK